MTVKAWDLFSTIVEKKNAIEIYASAVKKKRIKNTQNGVLVNTWNSYKLPVIIVKVESIKLNINEVIIHEAQ